MFSRSGDPNFITLRQRAEQALANHRDDLTSFSAGTIRELIHELRVHEVELQLQNEELLRSRQEAEAERDRFANLYDSVPVGCLTLQYPGIIQASNRAGRLLLVDSSIELIGRSFGDFVRPEDQDAYFLFLRRLFQTHRQHVELRMQRSKNVAWVAQIEAQVTTGTTDAEGVCQMVISDITARKQADMLRAQRDWLDVTLSSMGDALITVDANGAITFLNRAAMEFTGWPAQSAIGQPLHQILPLVDEQTQQPASLQVRHLLQSETDTDLATHMVWVSQQGQERVVAACAAPISTTIGPPQEAVIVFRDIREQRHMEARLRQTQKMEALGTLAGGIAHDFNNLLAVILGFAHISEQSLVADHPVLSYLKEVNEAARRGKALVQHILTFTNRHQIERVPVDMYPLVQNALSMGKATLPATIDIQPDLNPNVGTILAEATQVHQVIMNLYANAEYSMRQHGGTLRVGLHAVEVDTVLAAAHPSLTPGPYIRLTIEDTGPGIAADVLPHIFEPYYTTKATGEGSGLGLAIAHGIVTSHKGALSVESVPGVRTTFTVFLPRMAGTIAQRPVTIKDNPGGTEHILLVEDDRPVALAAEIQLRELGYTVSTYYTSTSALEAFQIDPYRFDLVITDQTMPSMTGEHFAQALHQSRADIPIILVTGFSHLIDAEKASRLGIDAFLLKPWERQEMAHTIRRVLGQTCS